MQRNMMTMQRANSTFKEHGRPCMGRARMPVAVLVIAIAGLIVCGTGCKSSIAGYELGANNAAVKDILLPTGSPEGLKWIENQKSFDKTIREYADRKGTPDFVIIGGRYRTHLVYSTENLYVTFQRPVYSSNSGSRVEEPIPSDMRWRIDAYHEQTSGYTPAPPAMIGSDGDPVVASSGTGFAVNADGMILTAFHVIEDANSVQVQFEGESPIPAKVLRSSRRNDLALLSINRKSQAWLAISYEDVAMAAQVSTIGFPVSGILGQNPKYTSGVVSATSGLHDDDTMTQITVLVRPGNSGGPLLDRKGQVVGMVLSTAAVPAFIEASGAIPQNVNFAIKPQYIAAFLGKISETAPSPIVNDPIDHAKRSVCLILCR